MSDTPRTDIDSPWNACMHREHCRNLQRELARALRVVEAARKWGDKNAEPYEYMVLEQAIEEWEAGR